MSKSPSPCRSRNSLLELFAICMVTFLQVFNAVEIYGCCLCRPTRIHSILMSSVRDPLDYFSPHLTRLRFLVVAHASEVWKPAFNFWSALDCFLRVSYSWDFRLLSHHLCGKCFDQNDTNLNKLFSSSRFVEGCYSISILGCHTRRKRKREGSHSPSRICKIWKTNAHTP